MLMNYLANVVLSGFSAKTWDDIEKVEPDDWDLEMLKEIDNDPECHQYTNANDIDWNDPE